MNNISLKEFIHYFTDQAREDKKFCFILGAGASKASGIPTGGELAQDWFEQMSEKCTTDELTEWIAEKNIDSNNLAVSYCDIYDRRFSIRKEDGYAYLESIMEGKTPSVGYSFLAQILAQGHHRVVITTNFDSLTEDALFIYTEKKPLVVGHENLAQFIKAVGKRPLVIKVHRDLLLSPRNDADGVGHLADEFAKNLEAVLKHYTPLVIGYGGNDGGFMEFLDQLNEINGGIFWFYRESDPPNEKIQGLVAKYNGRFVPITGFDDLLIQLGNQLELEKLDKRITDIAESRAKTYREQIEAITKARKDGKTEEALSNIVQRGERTWWNYELEASETVDPNKQERIYREGLKQFPSSHELMGNYAIFLEEIRKDPDRAEDYYKKALKLEPDEADYLGNYALLLTDVRRDHDRADELFKKALRLDASHVHNLGNYAKFLIDIGKRSEARKCIDKAFLNNTKEEIETVSLELWFYCYAIFPEAYPQSRQKIEEYLDKGVQSIGWNLDGVLAVAKKQKHPHYAELVAYAKRITEPTEAPKSKRVPRSKRRGN